MEFRCVFLNCYNLCLPGSNRSGAPRDAADLYNKIDALARTLRTVFPDDRPELVALCEVGARDLARSVGQMVGGADYRVEWSGEPPDVAGGPQTGLAVLYDPAVLERKDLDLGQCWRTAGARDKWFPVLFQLRGGSKAPFWLVANHWKSRRGLAWQTENARRETARQIGEFYLSTARIQSEAMILVGDFNCEPSDRPFYDQKINQDSPNQLRAVRERALVLREKNKLAYFYNPMWRWLGEQDPYELTLHASYTSTRPMGTYCADWGTGVGWNLWDQILVAKPVLSGGLIRLREGSLALAPPSNKSSDQDKCSDHGAIGAIFDYGF